MDEKWEIDVENCGAAAPGRWKEFPSVFGHFHHSLIERVARKVSSSRNVLLEWIILGARTVAPLFAILSGDVATPGVTIL